TCSINRHSTRSPGLCNSPIRWGVGRSKPLWAVLAFDDLFQLGKGRPLAGATQAGKPANPEEDEGRRRERGQHDFGKIKYRLNADAVPRHDDHGNRAPSAAAATAATAGRSFLF